MASHEVSPEFGLPKLELLVGPLMMVHFFLGWFVMYPDLTVVKYSSHITPNFNKFGRDNGTVTVTVDMVVRGTKLLDIPVADWLPSSEKFQLLNARDMGETAPHSSSSGSSSSSSNIGFTATAPVPLKIPRRSNPAKPPRKPRITTITTSTTTTNNNTTKKTTTTMTTTTTIATTGTATAPSSNSIINNNDNNNSRCSSTSKAVVAAKPLPVAVYGGGELSLRDSNIPESYIDVLHSKAIMLPIPQKMHSRVILRMQLDEKNFIKSVNSSMIQLR
jgi:hypothetical protein